MQVSHSRVECFKKCPYQYKLRYKDKLKTYFNNDPANALIIGTALHTGIEKDKQTAIKEYYSNYPIINDLHVAEAIKLEAVIDKCRDIVPEGLHEVKIECPEFIGFIDLLVPVEAPEKVESVIEGIDPMTNVASKLEIYEYVEGDYEWFDMYDFKYSNNVKNYLESGQLHEYKYYFEKLNPTKRIRNMYFLFAPKVQIRQKKTETLLEFRKRLNNELKDKDAQLVPITYDTTKVKDFLRNAKECKSATKFEKNPTRLCDWCEFQKYCEEGEELEIMNLPSTERRTVAANNHKKIWLYGVPFCGKTYLANQFPTPLMLNTDGNYKYVDAPVIPIKDEVWQEGRLTKRKYAWELFKETVDELEKQDNDFKTIVVDLTEDIYDACRVKVCVDKGWEHESDDSFKAYDIVRSEFLRTMKRLLNLDYDIVLISHEDTSKDITKRGGDKVTQIKPNIPEKVASKLAGMVDIVARVIDDEGNHIVSFKTNEVIFGGGRLKLDVKEIDSSYDNICGVYENANKGKKAAPKPTKKEKVEEVKEEPTEPVPEEPKRKPRKAAEPEVEVETADAPPVETETPETPKRRTRKPVEEPKVDEAPTEAPAEETPAPTRRRRRRTE